MVAPEVPAEVSRSGSGEDDKIGCEIKDPCDLRRDEDPVTVFVSLKTRKEVLQRRKRKGR